MEDLTGISLLLNLILLKCSNHFCKLFKLNVLVKSFPNNRDIEFIENKNNNWIFISWTGNHFDPIGRQVINTCPETLL
jgi:hypothetical protein